MGIISWLVVGAIAGVLAGYLVKGDEGLGLIGRIALGIIGALVGGFLAGLLFPGEDFVNGINITSIITATIGAIIVVVGYNMVRGRTRTGSGPI
ncbi:MAG TPA: GlsB/YeaQ/YmgE family stress response membrane protein [Candidatus Limnocylindria bacterium]|nr:GlsB/YeaQ/YmgE family stress response membrane protein [Candidatus Limnocylindria bacterium]